MGSKAVSVDEFLEKANKEHNFKYDYSAVDYKNTIIKIEIVCKEHGSFWQRPYSHIAGAGCSKCTGNAKMTLLEFMSKARNIHGDLYNYEDVQLSGAHSHIKIGCKKHGIFEQSPAAHLRLEQGCPTCSYEKIPDRHAHHKALFVEKAIKVHGNFYDYSLVEYTRSRFKVDIICPVHGLFSQIANNHLKGSGCYSCNLGGFTDNLAGFVYILQDGATTKVGITNQNPYIRADVINKMGSKLFSVKTAFKFVSGKDAKTVEKQILTYLKTKYEQPIEKFHGSTECFLNTDIADVISKLCLCAVKFGLEVYPLRLTSEETT